MSDTVFSIQTARHASTHNEYWSSQPTSEEQTMGDRVPIASMPLYTNLDRIEKGIADLGIGPNDPILPEQLFPFDQWHYHGVNAVRRATEELALRSGSRVLDVGSGIGGPARYLAHVAGCHVSALELQTQLHDIASGLTTRSGLSERVTHLCGDALDYPISEAAFDAVVSWLAVYHIPDRPRLCAKLARALRPGGGCYIEDLYMRAPFSPEDLRDVHDVLVDNAMTAIDAFIADLKAAGFVRIRSTDLTDETKPFVAARLAAWQQDSISHKHQYGPDAYTAMETFYSTVKRLFDNGSLGCVRLLAYKP